MSDRDDIPVLTDLIEKGIRIDMSDLGLENQALQMDQPAPEADAAEDYDLHIEAEPVQAVSVAADPAANNKPFHHHASAPSDFDPESSDHDPDRLHEPVYERQREQASGSEFLDDNPALEQAIRRILDEHVELAWQEIRLAIQQEKDKS